MGIKENFLFKNIEWLMKVVDARSVLERLGVHPNAITKSGDELETFCPDHYLFVGRKSSDPNWSVNIKSGKCKCRTEPRGSNLVYTVARLRDCSPREAAEWMVGGEAAADLNMASMKALSSLPDDMRAPEDEDAKPVIEGLHSIEEEAGKGFLSQSAIDFFKCPPGKAPSNIQLKTLRHYKVFERTWGYYHDRIIIPIYFRGEVFGFSAIDKWGKREWLRRNPLKTEGDYKKVLFPKGMSTGSVLFGFDDITPGCPMLTLTEGPREVMKMRQEGYPNAVALHGTNLSGAQFKLLAELRPKAVAIMLDGDAAGVRATLKIGRKIKETFGVMIIDTPEGLDPKVMCQRDFKALFRHANKIDKRLA